MIERSKVKPDPLAGSLKQYDALMQLGQRAYLSYADYRLKVDQVRLPKWVDLKVHDQEAWAAAADVLRDTVILACIQRLQGIIRD